MIQNHSVGRRARVSHACNACRRRKVRCNSEQDCDQCLQVGLRCVYAIPSSAARSRRSIVPGHVIKACEKADTSQPSVDITTSFSYDRTLPDRLRDGEHLNKEFSAKFFLDLVDDYRIYVLPTVPIIGEFEFKSAIGNLSRAGNDCSLVYCLAAQTLNLTCARSGRNALNADDATILFTKALRSRKPVFSFHHITVHSIMVPLLVSIGLFANDRDITMGFFYIQEAIAGIQALEVHNLDKQATLNPKERAQRERLHWLLYVHERFHCLLMYRPAVLDVLPKLPDVDSSLSPDVSEWFHQLIWLFTIVDQDFIRNWIDKQSSTLTLEWIEKKQADLAANDQDAEHGFTGAHLLTDMQQVDLVVTRYWLRTLIWQMTLRKFPLKSDDAPNRDTDFMSFAFPMQLSHRLRQLLATKPREAIEVHGTGMLMKIFEITCTLADIILYIVANTCRDARARVDHLECYFFLHSFLLRMSKFYHIERNILADKFAAVSFLFPAEVIVNATEDTTMWLEE